MTARRGSLCPQPIAALGAEKGLLAVDFLASRAATRRSAGGRRQEGDNGHDCNGKEVFTFQTEERRRQFYMEHDSPIGNDRRLAKRGLRRQEAERMLRRTVELRSAALCTNAVHNIRSEGGHQRVSPRSPFR